MQKEVMTQQHDLVDTTQPDLIIYNQKCLYPMIWGMKHPGRTILLSPLPCTVHEYDGHAALGMGSDHGKFMNKLSYRFSNFFLFQTVKSSIKKYQKELGLKLSAGKIREHMLRKEKMIYTISPSLFERPTGWPQNVQIVGYHDKTQQSDWKPDEELQQFVGKYEKILFITFGSMTNPEPEQKTSDMMEVLEKHQIPAIINTASGGLVKPSIYPERIHFVESIPYSYIFPKVYAVIHHGGSGTTHTAIRFGCASMIIPHILDQHVWNDIISQKGLGPKGFPIKKFSKKRFEEKLLDLWNNWDYKNKSEETSRLMRMEDLEKQMMEFVLNK
jgi:UDP:flavonoid glycosyltransferase YjiC (YdhE family)